MESSYVQSGYYLLPYSQPYWPSFKTDLLIIKSSKSIQNIVKILIKFHQKTRGTNIGKFQQLYKVHQAKTIKTFNNMASFILEHQEYYTVNNKRFPLFAQHHTFLHTFHKRDVVLMMCIICLCISTPVKVMNDKFHTKLTSQTDCAGVYAYYLRKIPFLLNYFDIAFEELNKNQNNAMTISRLKLVSLRHYDVLKIEDKLLKIQIENNQNSLDDFTSDTRAKVDFANRFIGGGTLNRGCVQQEIMFLNHTQACISILLCDPMLDNEAIGLYGFKKYFKNTGYSTTTQFQGQEKFQYTMGEKGHLNDYIIAIDAQSKQPNQYSVQSIMRELNKCRSGFSLFDEDFKISTGNWGCGVFKGDVQLKFMIQWIAASIVKKRLVYYPYGNNKLNNVIDVIKRIFDQPINKVMKVLIDYDPRSKISVFDYLLVLFDNDN